MSSLLHQNSPAHPVRPTNTGDDAVHTAYFDGTPDLDILRVENIRLRAENARLRAACQSGAVALEKVLSLPVTQIAPSHLPTHLLAAACPALRLLSPFQKGL